MDEPTDPAPTEPAPSDPLAELVREAARGDVGATRRLLDAVAPHILRIARGMLGAHHPDLADVFQASLLGCVHALPAFRGECTVVHFAVRVAYHRASTTRRRVRRADARVDALERRAGPLSPDAHAPPDAHTLAERRRALLRVLLEEEQLTPDEQLGREYIAARLPSRYGEDAVFRVIATADATRITFDPPAPVLGAEITLNADEWHEFVTPGHHVVRGSAPFMLAQFEPGAGFAIEAAMRGGAGYAVIDGMPYDGGCASNGPIGDPDLLVHAAPERFLSRYTVRTDRTYVFDFLLITRRVSSRVTIDCLGDVPASAFAPVAGTGWEVGAVFLDHPRGGAGSCRDGTHVVEGAAPFGLVVSGTHNANSYTFLGGMRF